MREIPLYRGYGRTREKTIVAYAKVDDEDYEALNRNRWSLHSCGYAVRYTHPDRGKTKSIKMPEEIFALHELERGRMDHINRDRLDNRKANLRYATHGQNMQNRRANTRSKTGLRGIWFHKGHQKWEGRVKHDGRVVFRKYASSPEDLKTAVASARARWLEFAVD